MKSNVTSTWKRFLGASGHQVRIVSQSISKRCLDRTTCWNFHKTHQKWGQRNEANVDSNLKRHAHAFPHTLYIQKVADPWPLRLYELVGCPIPKPRTSFAALTDTTKVPVQLNGGCRYSFLGNWMKLARRHREHVRCHPSLGSNWCWGGSNSIWCVPWCCPGI